MIQLVSCELKVASLCIFIVQYCCTFHSECQLSFLILEHVEQLYLLNTKYIQNLCALCSYITFFATYTNIILGIDMTNRHISYRY